MEDIRVLSQKVQYAEFFFTDESVPINKFAGDIRSAPPGRNLVLSFARNILPRGGYSCLPSFGRGKKYPLPPNTLQKTKKGLLGRRKGGGGVGGFL